MNARQGGAELQTNTLAVPGDVPVVQATTEQNRALRPAIAIVALAAVFVIGVAVGPVNVPFRTVITVVLDELGLVSSSGPTAIERQIVWDVRVPRVLLGMLVGAALATAGAVIQAVVRNPLGDPYLLGIVPGASLGAVAVIVGVGSAAASISLGAAAFFGSLVAFALTFLLGREHGRWPPARPRSPVPAGCRK